VTQSRRHSLAEAMTNTVVGLLVTLGAQLVVYPFYGATFTFSQNAQITLIFTALSIARSYILRRWFNRHR
jgi:hypothetical protein